MKSTNKTIHLFVIASSAIHMALWYVYFENRTPIHSGGAKSMSQPLQVNLIRYAQEEQGILNHHSKAGEQKNNSQNSSEKSQTLKQVMVTLKNDDTKSRVTEKARKAGKKPDGLPHLTAEAIKPIPAQPIPENIVKTAIGISDSITHTKVSTGTNNLEPLSQLQIAKVTAHLTKAFDQYFSYPRLAQRKGWQGSVKLGLRIESNGTLSNIRVLSTSGYQILDQAALNTLHRISTLENVDKWLNGLHFDTVIPIHYKLVDS